MLPIPIDRLPDSFPDRVPNPKFQIGDRVQWNALPTQDFGTITGIQYAPAPHLQAWDWEYTIWLDCCSPSRPWVTIDTAWETDLEPFPSAIHP